MKQLNIGMIGTGFMAKAHSRAYANMERCISPAPAKLILRAIADIDKASAEKGARQYGFEKAVVGWESIVNDDSIDIVSILTPNYTHKEICLSALKRGKHIICEKPLANNAGEAKEIWVAAKKLACKNLVAYNYRRIPAVILAKNLIDDGTIGEIRNFRGNYLSDWARDERMPTQNWRFQTKYSGAGALGDTGSHVIDLARYLVGEVSEVSAMLRTWIEARPSYADANKMDKVDNDDDAILMLKFNNGAIGTIQTSRTSFGRKNYIYFQIDGSRGSLYYNYENIDELYLYDTKEREYLQGFKRILTGPVHAYGELLWPVAKLGIGFEELKIIEIYDFVRAIIDGNDVKPDFYDGWRICEIVDSASRSAKSGAWEKVLG